MPLVMSPTIAKLAEALCAAQGEMAPAKKNATNPHFRSTYADLASCYEASRPAMVRHGLSIVQLPGRRDDGTTTLTTMLLHVSGEFIGDECGVKVQDTAQAAGSAMTYLRRYAYSAMIGLATEDDDGAAASQPAPRPQTERPASQPTEQRQAAPAEAPSSSDRNDPPCPVCSGPMWDNRQKKASGAMSAKAPDFKCKDKQGCEGVIWPPRSGGSRPRVQSASPPPAAPPVEDDGNGEIPF